MNPGKGDILYFLGIGGIGMSALARYFQWTGASIYGYDKTPSPITDSLMREGMHIHFDDRPDLIPAKTTMVIYTPAIPSTLKEFITLKASGIPMMKRAEVLGSISRSMPTIAVAGTHGKTTVSSMIAHIIHEAGIPITAFIGGIANNFGSNLVLNKQSQWLVVEADEYDRSFLHLKPQLAVITSMDPDHLDIYGSKESMVETYSRFAATVPKEGKLIIRKGLEVGVEETGLMTFTIAEDADFSVGDIRVLDDKFYFTVHTPAGSFDTSLGMPGNHNILNALAATAACMQAGIEPAVIARALPKFKGVWRRFDIIINRPGMLYIDDYAHHPEELKAAINTVRSLRPQKNITGIFQPHLYSRTRDFMDDFAQSLALLDQLILLDIYPAREQPIEGVSSAVLLEKVPIRNKMLLNMEQTINYLRQHPSEVVMTLGAGDIDRLVAPLKKMLEE